MATTDVTASEMTESLTGFDEIAIQRAFDFDPYSQGEKRPMMLMRVLVFVHRRREGDTDPQAKKAALELTVSGINEYFVEDEPDDDDDPVTESGKDAGTPVKPPATSPHSVSVPESAPATTPI